MDSENLEESINPIENIDPDKMQKLLKDLSEVIKCPTKSEIARSLAALQLRNSLHSKEESSKSMYQERWLQLPEDVRSVIKSNCLEALSIDTKRPSQTAQCLAYIACIEIPRELWDGCISELVGLMNNESSNDDLKESSLEAICYILKEINPALIEADIGNLLKCIQNCIENESSENVKLASVNILFNSMELTRLYFPNQEHSAVILDIISKSLEPSMNEATKLVALKYLEKLVEMYYELHRMTPYILEETVNLIKSSNDEITIQSIYFWINISKTESKLDPDEKEEDLLNHKRYTFDSLDTLMPLLFDRLMEQREDENEDEWTPYKAAAVCIILLATSVEDMILKYLLPFIDENIKSEDWKLRDASLVALSAVLKLQNIEIIKEKLEEKLELLKELLDDQNHLVKDTTECLVYRICNLMPEKSEMFTHVKEFHLKSFKFFLINKDLFDYANFKTNFNKNKKYKVDLSTVSKKNQQENGTDNLDKPAIKPDFNSIFSTDSDIRDESAPKPLINLDEVQNRLKSLKKIGTFDNDENLINTDENIDKEDPPVVITNDDPVVETSNQCSTTYREESPSCRSMSRSPKKLEKEIEMFERTANRSHVSRNFNISKKASRPIEPPRADEPPAFLRVKLRSIKKDKN